MADHFWAGSLCLEQDSVEPRPSFPRNVIAIRDSIAILQDMENRIPDKSWMLYLLELFDNRKIAVELNLICQFNDRDNFWAIFKGTNRYKFTRVLPLVGHSYDRRMVMCKHDRSIKYSVTDRKTGEFEEFNYEVNDAVFTYQGVSHFTGIEWWNKAGSNCPFPIRYKVGVSDLMYGQPGGGSISYHPYSALAPDSDGTSGVKYPVSFDRLSMTDGKGIGYVVS